MQALSPYKNILMGFSNRQDPNEGLDATKTPDLYQPTSNATYKSIIKKVWGTLTGKNMAQSAWNRLD